MSNTQDLLSILGGNVGRPGPGRSIVSSDASEKTILSFKAGKMVAESRPNGKYLVSPDARRGEIIIKWTTARNVSSSSNSGSSNNNSSNDSASRGNNNAAGHLKFEWKDRRTRTIVHSIPIFPEDDATFERVVTGNEDDRVYLLQLGSGSNSRHFFWMQDKASGGDEDICLKVNLYMSDYTEAAVAAGVIPSTEDSPSPGSSAAPVIGGTNIGGNAMDNAELLRIMQGALGSQGTRDSEGARSSAVAGEGSFPAASSGQVDALGNILENFGIPQPAGTTPANERRERNQAPVSNSSSVARGGALTLADLQGAMAGLATTSPPSSVSAPPAPSLAHFTTAEVIDESRILDDPVVTARLVELLPEGQRSEEKLRENIRSPQVAQCLQRLTSALTNENASSFNSIIANFQFNPEDGTTALMAGNPIEAFLNCLAKDVERNQKGTNSDQREVDGNDEGDENGEGDEATMDES